MDLELKRRILYYFARATITKYHSVDNLNNTYLFLIVLDAKFKVLADLVSSEANSAH